MGDYSQYFGDIEQWIAEKGSVTYRGMACSLNISVSISKCALYQFLEKKNTKMKSTVLSVGRDGSALFSFKFITVDDFDGVKKMLGNAKEKHVYALHCPDSSEHPNLAIQGQDFNQVEEATRGSSTLASYATNAVGLVHMAGIDSNVRKVRKPPSAAAPKSQPIKPNSMSSGKSSSAAASSSASEVTAKAKLASKANAFFGNTVKANEKKVATKEKKVSTEKPAVAAVVVKEKEQPVIKDAKKKTIVEEDWDEEDSDDEVASSSVKGKNVPDKEKIKKRQISASAPQGSGGTHQSDVILNDLEADDSASEEDEDNTGGGKRKRKKKKSTTMQEEEEEEPKEKVVFKKHGAMDDFIEDAALKEKERSTEAAIAGEAPKRVKRKKLVEKMFADEKGYLVTEMVMEEVSEDETDEPAAETLKRSQTHPKPTPAAAKKAKPTPAAAKKGTGSKSTGQQKSMMSFFGKK